MAEDRGQPIEWDDEIEREGAPRHVFPAGTVVLFKALKLERKRTDSGNAMAKLVLELSDGTNTGQCFDNLVLSTSCEWKLCSFFGALGMRKHGEKFRMDWDNIIGKRGACKVSVRRYEKDGKSRPANDIEEYIYAEDVDKSIIGKVPEGAVIPEVETAPSSRPAARPASDDPLDEDNLPF